MSKRGRRGRTLEEHSIFGDEEAAQLRADLDELKASMAEMNDRVHSQFTTIAAHAEIARQQAEFVREEGRADLERTRETLIELMERVRTEVTSSGDVHVPGSAPGVSGAAQNERFTVIEEQIADLCVSVERCYSRQNELADTMAAFLDTVLAQQRGEPVAGLSLA